MTNTQNRTTDMPVNPPVGIDVIKEGSGWEQVKLTQLCHQAFGAVVGERGISHQGYQISVLGCDDSKIRQLNEKFRAKPVPTNVLCWPSCELAPLRQGDDPEPPLRVQADSLEVNLGDIAVSYETCLREAEEFGISFEDHLSHLLVHSCLHLLGFDHENDADAERMEKLETKILASLGIAAPY